MESQVLGLVKGNPAKMHLVICMQENPQSLPYTNPYQCSARFQLIAPYLMLDSKFICGFILPEDTVSLLQPNETLFPLFCEFILPIFTYIWSYLTKDYYYTIQRALVI